jgi:hypothetical protein
MLSAVVDSTVLVSAFLSKQGAAAAFLARGVARAFTCMLAVTHLLVSEASALHRRVPGKTKCMEGAGPLLPTKASVRIRVESCERSSPSNDHICRPAVTEKV